jgi:ubiquitin-protein ligase E3 C
MYATFLSLCHQNDDLQQLSVGIVGALSFSPIVVRKLWVFLNLFGGNLSNMLYSKNHEYYGVLVVFLTLYYTNLLVSDSESFETNNLFNAKETIELTHFINNLAIEFHWNYDAIKDNRITAFLAYQSSRLVKLLFEFNQTKEFIPRPKWEMEKNRVEKILNDVKNGSLSKTILIKRVPHAMPFKAKVEIFKKCMEAERRSTMSTTKIVIRRSAIFEDGFKAFCGDYKVSKPDLKGRLSVIFVDEFGQYEEGIDGGGLFKEFMTELLKIIFYPGYGLFKINEKEQSLYPNPESRQILGAEHLEYFYFVGLVVGRAIYDNILIDAEFAQFFLRRLLGKANHLNELQNLDTELYNNLKFLKTYQGSVTDLCLTFSIVNPSDSSKEIELIPGGRNIAVDETNKIKYIYNMAFHKLNTEIKDQCTAFMNGVSSVINWDWFKIFTEDELQVVISGAKHAFNVEDLKKHTVLKGYSSFEGTIRDFWKIVDGFTEQEKQLLLKFVTSCSKPPLLGFANLDPPFTIQHVENPDGEKLPTSSTCFNILKLPKYSSTKKLKEKLLLSIKSGAGFNLA